MTKEQNIFLAEYLIDTIPTQAAIHEWDSKKTAVQVGHENLRKPQTAAAVEGSMRESGERTQTSVDWVARRLADNHTTAKAKGDISESTRDTTRPI